jgi:hypothetical protein
MSARRRGDTLARNAALLTDLGFVLALVGVATFAAWPIYQSWYMVITVAGAVLIAGGVVLLGRARSWSWPLVVLAMVAAYIVFGVPLAVPRAFVSRMDFVASYRDLLAATVGDWKKLITVQTPVGHYQTLLVPLLVTVLVCTTAAFALIVGRARSYGWLVPIMLIPTAFAIAFGTSANGPSFEIGGFPIAAVRHTIVGVVALGLAGGFLVWRGQNARTVALREAAAASGIRRSGGTLVSNVRRIVSAVAVALIGLAIAVPVASSALVPGQRQVLRSAVDPSAQLRQYVSPLTTYRTAFDPAPDLYNTTLLNYTGDSAKIGRLRLATLSFYNGRQYTVLPSDSDRSSAFERIPQLTSTTQQGASAKLTVTIDKGYGEVVRPAVWMPTADGLRAVGFHGHDVNELTDGFFYNRDLEAGAELRDFVSGDSYTLLAAPSSVSASLATLTPPPGAVPQESVIPDSLTEWVQSQGLGRDGASLAELVDRLRQRGYLSHGLVTPGLGTASAHTWLADTGTQVFKQSLAGESMDRISGLFSDLLRQQQQTAGGAGAPDAKLVAAVGDDEQFAVASALVAESLGFPARVVLGFALDQGVVGEGGIPACSGGACQGKNLTAWIEVQAADGSWLPFTTTPQSKVPLAEKQITTNEPKLPTQVQQHVATVQPPPEANPTGGDRQNNARSPKATGPSLVWLPVLRVGGTIVLVLMVLIAPLVSIAIVKAARRRERRGIAAAAGRMAAGWDELVDTAVDLGLPAPGVRTRAETAAVYGAASRSADSAHLRTLASSADDAVFGAFDPSPEEAQQYWVQLDEQRTRLAAGFPRWKRLAALISLRSFRSGGGDSA